MATNQARLRVNDDPTWRIVSTLGEKGQSRGESGGARNEREHERDLGAALGDVHGRGRSAVRLDDSPDQRQPEAHSMGARRAGRVGAHHERLEGAGEERLAEAGAAIAHRHSRRVPIDRDRDLERLFLGMTVVPGVAEQIVERPPQSSRAS